MTTITSSPVASPTAPRQDTSLVRQDINLDLVWRLDYELRLLKGMGKDADVPITYQHLQTQLANLVMRHLDKLSSEIERKRMIQSSMPKIGTYHRYASSLSYRDKLMRIDVPTVEDFNIVGRLFGPEGKTLQGISRITRCKINVRGKGSVRKEQAEQKKDDPDQAHLKEPLHIHVVPWQCVPDACIRETLEDAKTLLMLYMIPLPPQADELKKKQLNSLAELRRRDRERSCKFNKSSPTPYSAGIADSNSYSYANGFASNHWSGPLSSVGFENITSEQLATKNVPLAGLHLPRVEELYGVSFHQPPQQSTSGNLSTHSMRPWSPVSGCASPTSPIAHTQFSVAAPKAYVQLQPSLHEASPPRDSSISNYAGFPGVLGYAQDFASTFPRSATNELVGMQADKTLWDPVDTPITTKSRQASLALGSAKGNEVKAADLQSQTGSFDRAVGPLSSKKDLK